MIPALPALYTTRCRVSVRPPFIPSAPCAPASLPPSLPRSGKLDPYIFPLAPACLPACLPPAPWYVAGRLYPLPLLDLAHCPALGLPYAPHSPCQSSLCTSLSSWPSSLCTPPHSPLGNPIWYYFPISPLYPPSPCFPHSLVKFGLEPPMPNLPSQHLIRFRCSTHLVLLSHSFSASITACVAVCFSLGFIRLVGLPYNASCLCKQ